MGKLILFIIILVLIIAMPILIITLRKEKNKFIGTWTTDGVTTYKFNKDKTGVLILPLSEYEFIYSLKDNTIFIDFDNAKSEDSKYDYSFKDGKLILENENGKFIFTKND